MTDEKISRSHKSVSSGHIQRLLDRGITVKDLCEHFGNTPSAIHEWLRTGKAPKITLLAAEAIERRMGKSGGNTLLLVKVPSKYLDALAPILSTWGATVTRIDM